MSEASQFENFTIDFNTTIINNTGNEYIFDKTYIRALFISLYTLVFCLCFFGNFLVILVVTLSRRLRSSTNFFLANLAVADFSVAVFCIYQNLWIYMIESWILGDFLCKMYMFIQSLSNTASIFILVVICKERFFAILYPITCKQILTPKRLRKIIAAVWLLCIIYSSPKFYFGNTVTHISPNGHGQNISETVCVLDRTRFNSKYFDICHFVLLYLTPLANMSILYTKIAVCLWNSSEQLKKQLNASDQEYTFCRKPSSRYKNQDKKVTNGTSNKPLHSTNSNTMPNPNSSQNVLRARRGVIKMLIIVVCAFAICHLPLHVRKMWQYWSPHYHGNSNFSALLTPLTFLSTYLNSAINPLLYAFLSKNFRRGMREILLCSYRRKRQQNNRNHMSLHVGIQRHASTRSTMKANATTVTILNNEQSSECSHEV